MLKKIILTLLILNISTQAMAYSADRDMFADQAALEESTILSIVSKIIEFFDIFAREAIPKMLTSFKGLFAIIVSMLFLFVVFRWFKQGAIIPSELISILLLLGLVTTVILAVGSKYYFDNIFVPITDFVIAFPSYIISIGSGTSSATNLQGLFVSFDSMISRMYDLTSMMLSQAKWYNKPSIVMQAGVLYLIYTIFRVCFLWVFMQGVLSVFVMLIILPFGILLTPFSASRGLFSNTMKALSSYCLQPTFAAIMISVIMFAATDLSNQANELVSMSELSLQEINFSKFLTYAITLGIVGIFMTMKSSEYANQIMMGAISQSNFSSVGTAAGTLNSIRGGKAALLGAFGSGTSVAAGHMGVNVMGKLLKKKK
jgi:hypothetical protein